MPGIITVNKDLPADDNDILLNTMLDPVPGPGTLAVWIASSARDGRVTVTGPGLTGAYNVPPILRANGIPDLNADVPFLIQVEQGKYILAYDEVGAADAFATIIYMPG